MTKNVLINYLKTKVVISQEDEEYINISFAIKSFKKNEIISEKGEVCKYLFFLDYGVTRNYYLNHKGNEITRHITYENKFFTNFLSFNNLVPSKEIIECVEDCQVYFIDKEKFNLILEKIPLTKQVFLEVLMEYHVSHLERLEEFNCMSPLERFENFIDKHSRLAFSLSNKLLASYLGITQETCSRLKRQLLVS